MDGIIFDVDGTLWDSTDVVAEAWNLAISEHTDLKADLTGDRLKSLFGKTMEEIFEVILPSLPAKEQTRIGYLCYDYENALLAKKPGTLYEGVYTTLETLSKKTDLYIVSNCQCGYIEILLETTGLGRFIKGHLCFGETETPKSQTILKLMEQHHIDSAVYVGDTKGDYDSCQEANIPFIFAEYGFGNVPEATERIHSITELLEYSFNF